MRLVPLLPLLLTVFPQPTLAQSWEKPVAPGVTYRMEVDLSLPRIIHSLRMTPAAPGVRAATALAGDQVYRDDGTKGRATVSEMVRLNKAIGGINGDYFPYTGDPLGFMLSSGKLISAVGDPVRSVFAWGQSTSGMGLVKTEGALTPENGSPLTMNGLNEECPLNKIVLNTAVAGLAIAKLPNVHLVYKIDSGDWTPGTEVQGTLTSVVADADRMVVPTGCFVVSAQGTQVATAKGMVIGSKASARWKVDGFDWSQTTEAIGGGPFLLRSGKVDIDAEAQRFPENFSSSRHPRSAIGRTSEGDLIFAVVDGRQSVSIGATLEEMAVVMQRLGCVDAMNLDGGGSSDLVLRGVVLNRPSEGSERPVSNGVLVFGANVIASKAPLSLAFPPKLAVGGSVTLQVVVDGKPVPTAEVLWGTQGAGWIDQGGLLRGLKIGKAEVSAFCRGQLLRATIAVVAKI
jgi:hypothetical protein